MSFILMKDRFCIYNGSFQNAKGKEGYHLHNGIYSLYKKKSFQDRYVFINGVIYNIDNIKTKFQLVEVADIEQIILQLYDKVGINIASILEGIYSIVIVDKTRILLFRDRFSIENIYYFKKEEPSSFIVANSLKELKKFIRLEVNIGILPKYFLFSQLNGGNTFVKDVFTLKTFEVLSYDILTGEWQSTEYEDLPYQWIKTRNIDDTSVISEADNMIRNFITGICKMNPSFSFVNSFSGGVDSSLVQVYLKELGFNYCYTACYYPPYGNQVEKYSRDVADYLKAEHKLVRTELSEIIRYLDEGIEHCEIPYIFEGEWLTNRMYHAISDERSGSEKGIIEFDGNGADTVYGHGKNLLELKYLSISWMNYLFNYFNKYVIKYLSKSNYKHYDIIIRGIKSNNIDSQFISAIFGSEIYSELIQEAFNLEDISFIYEYEIEQLKKYNGPLIEKIYRLKIFEYELTRENNINYQLMKANNIIGIFPFLNLNLIKYLLQIPTTRKIRKLSFKYYQKKILSKYLPREFVYRKKITRSKYNSPDVFQNEDTFISVIDEIKRTKYPYFDFDMDALFSNKEFYSIAIKLINFHLWHKKFIDS